MKNQQSVFRNFISRSGDKLMDGEEEFRFISFNIPELTMNEEPSWHMPDPWEQEDALRTIVQMGGRVVRPYVLSVRKSSDGPEIKRHVKAPGEFDDDAFKALDKALELCNRYGVRIIIPLVDQWHWWGGISEYAAFRGKEWVDEHKHRGQVKNEFWIDRQIIDDFKKTIEYVIHRKNTYTGVTYKDDKAILAWETGNELFAPDSWVREIAAFIKSMDSNHLVMDGNFGVGNTSLDNPNVDILSNHYYGGKEYAAMCEKDRDKTKGKKPFVVGEFGIAPTPVLRELMEKVIDNGTSGALVWSLRQHNKAGGFYHHSEYEVDGVLYKSYHWPGFPFGEAYDEAQVVHMTRGKAYEIQGKEVPALDPPASPELLPIHTVLDIRWKGAVGAAFYDVERSEYKEGPWTRVGENVSDSVPVGEPLFSDHTAAAGKAYYYRVTAKNEAGSSLPSNAVGPVTLYNGGKT